MFLCHYCGTSAPYGAPIPRDAECPGCGRDLRACVQCRHHDPAYNNACRETEADPVAEKERRNFCEFFEPGEGTGSKSTDARRQSEARAKIEALFGRKDPGPE